MIGRIVCTVGFSVQRVDEASCKATRDLVRPHAVEELIDERTCEIGFVLQQASGESFSTKSASNRPSLSAPGIARPLRPARHVVRHRSFSIESAGPRAAGWYSAHRRGPCPSLTTRINSFCNLPHFQQWMAQFSDSSVRLSDTSTRFISVRSIRRPARCRRSAPCGILEAATICIALRDLLPCS